MNSLSEGMITKSIQEIAKSVEQLTRRFDQLADTVEQSLELLNKDTIPDE